MRIAYHKNFKKDFKKLPPVIQQKTEEVIRKLADDPHAGKPLSGGLKGLRRIRIGDYRLVYEFRKKEIILYLLRISIRSDVYR